MTKTEIGPAVHASRWWAGGSRLAGLLAEGGRVHLGSDRRSGASGHDARSVVPLGSSRGAGAHWLAGGSGSGRCCGLGGSGGGRCRGLGRGSGHLGKGAQGGSLWAGLALSVGHRGGLRCHSGAGGCGDWGGSHRRGSCGRWGRRGGQASHINALQGLRGSMVGRVECA